MDKVVFNFHDLILVMTAFQCCLFALLLISSKKFKRVSGFLLAGFLGAHALIPLHELIFYGAAFRWQVKEISLNLFFVGSFAYYLDGPILYLYIKSLMYRDFKIRQVHALHLIPVALYFIYMMFAYYGLEPVTKKQLIDEYTFAHIYHYVSIDAVIKTMRVVYTIFCLRLISIYRDRLKETHSSIHEIDLGWLKLLVIGFMVSMLWETALATYKVYGLFATAPQSTKEFMGVSSYYLVFALVNLLLFYSVVNITSVKKIGKPEQADKQHEPDLINTQYVERIENIMQKDRPYITPNITFDALADALDIPSRELSFTINRHYDMNFYEFINHYRIEEVKIILASMEHKDRSITDIFMSVGFNSKSVFNTFFKKVVGATPSEYRKSQLAKQA